VLYSNVKSFVGPGALFLCLIVADGAASAAPCAMGSLQSYTALGAGGCTIGSVQFTSFSLLPPVFTPINPTSVILTPTAVPGFLVGLNATAGMGQTLESTFSFTATGSTFISGSVGLLGSSVAPDGANTATGTFMPGGTAIAFDIGSDQQLTDTASIAKIHSVLVQLDYVVDGGTAGSASLSQGSVGLATVPEPSSLLLTFSALAGLAWKGRRQIPQLIRRQQ
jgi:hypothetical protein